MLIFYNDTVLYWSRKEQQAEKWIYLQPVTNVINCTVPTVLTVSTVPTVPTVHSTVIAL